MKKYRILTPFLATTTMFGAVTALTSCSNNMDGRIARDVLNLAVEEFEKITKIPRPTFYTRQIRTYVEERIRELGYTPQTDFVTEQGGPDQSANVWFDVPASKGYENNKKVIIQAHMDMVVAGVKEGEETSTPIEMEYHADNHTLTSKGCKTTLGADNGIGMGLIFALVQNKNIKHGPIRFLFTADEEQGMVGAKNIRDNHPEILDADYLICLDGELDKEGYYRSCQGSCGYIHRVNDFQLVNASNVQTLDILVEGFAGGHSGQDINKGRCNAIIFLLSMLLNLQGKNDVKLVKFNYQDSTGEEKKQTRNSIPSFARAKIVSDKSLADVNDAFKETVQQYKSVYDGEKWEDVKITVKTATESVKHMQEGDAKNIIALVTNNEDDGFVYGPYIVDPLTKRPLLSLNIANFYFNKDNDGKFEVTSYARSTTAEGITLMQRSLIDTWKHYYPDEKYEPKNADIIEPTYPWEVQLGDEIQKLADNAYRSIGIIPDIKDSYGGIENAVFVQAKPTLQLTSLGTKFENVHTVKETCYLDPLFRTIKVLKIILENLR